MQEPASELRAKMPWVNMIERVIGCAITTTEFIKNPDRSIDTLCKIHEGVCKIYIPLQKKGMWELKYYSKLIQTKYMHKKTEAEVVPKQAF